MQVCASYMQKNERIYFLSFFLVASTVEHLVETSASCKPSIKLSTNKLRCFYTATATESDVTNFSQIQTGEVLTWLCVRV